MSFTYKYRRKPYRHQVDALKRLISTKWGGALLMEPRTGKTQVCIDYASILHLGGKVNRVVIVCPVSVMSVWEDEIEAVCPVPHRTLVWDKRSRKRFQLPAYGKDVLDFVILNYDAFSTPGRVTGRDEDGALKRSRTRGGRFDIIRRLRNWQPQLLVLDESHRIKTPSARKTLGIRQVAHKRQKDGTYVELVPYRVIATGTAVTKKRRVYDLYAQWKFLNPNGWIKDYDLTTFKDEFSVHRSMGNYDRFIRNRNVVKLKNLIHPDAFAVTRDECFDLPPSRNQVHLVDLVGEGARVYDEMAEEMIAKIKEGEYTEAQIKLVQILRLAQITSGIAKSDSGKLYRVGREKLDLIADRLEDLWEADEKVVVAGRFRADIAAVAKIAKRKRKRGVRCYELHGGVGRVQRDINIKAFRAWDGPGVFIMQPQAGSLGIDLSTSATMIWFSLTQSYVDWTQSVDRIALSPRGTVIEYILARGTIDQLIFDSLMEDRDVAKMITESPDRLRRNYKAP